MRLTRKQYCWTSPDPVGYAGSQMHDVAKPDIDDLVRTLGDVCGRALCLVDGSVAENGAYLSATATSESAHVTDTKIKTNVMAKIFVGPSPSGAAETWALLFFYIDGIRVAPMGAHYLRVRLDHGRTSTPEWSRIAWEADEFDEWSNLERWDS